jgi:hypothetical protein
LDNEKHYGWLDDADVRTSAYWSMLAGAAGYTYGCNDIWQMYTNNRQPIIKARTGWKAALDLPGSLHMKFMKDVFQIFPWQAMQPDQSLILNNNPQDGSYIMSAIGANKDFILAYTPMGKPVTIDLQRINAERAKAYWFNPRSGKFLYIGEYETKPPHEFKPWSDGRGSDFLLVLVSTGATYDVSNSD